MKKVIGILGVVAFAVISFVNVQLNDNTSSAVIFNLKDAQAFFGNAECSDGSGNLLHYCGSTGDGCVCGGATVLNTKKIDK